MPDSAAMNKNGIVTNINSRIRTEPFGARYDLVGRELGRCVCCFLTDGKTSNCSLDGRMEFTKTCQ